jgi:SAM-dependent methyltransferase
MEALAALGAELRLRREGACTTAMRTLLRKAVQQIDSKAFDEITSDQESVALAVIDSFFRQSTDLLESPCRPPGWSYTDPVILNGQGLTSRRFVWEFTRLGTDRPDLAAMMTRPGALLDVGTGVGWLAIEAARTWPEWRVVGIDLWETSLCLARDNVARNGLANRIELRAQAVERLDDENVFTLAWLPGAFLSSEVVTVALDRILHALVPGGWLVFGLYAPPPGPDGEALNVLKIVRNGGYPWRSPDIEKRLHAAGFIHIESVSTPGTTLVVSQRKRT